MKEKTMVIIITVKYDKDGSVSTRRSTVGDDLEKEERFFVLEELKKELRFKKII